VGWIGEVAQLITAIVLALNFWQSWKNGRDIKAVKHATNSLTEQLVQTTGEKKYAEGLKHGEDYARRDGA
jgi:hypothetical protein